MKNCRFCGGKVHSDAFVCPHCQKTLRISEDEPKGGSGAIRLDEWSKYRVPGWVMYAIIALSAFTFYVMATGKFRPQPVDPPKEKKDESAQVIYETPVAVACLGRGKVVDQA